jgi:adenylate cyclase
MGMEIERKFLVAGDGWRPGPAGVRVRQGYLARAGNCTVRVRTQGDRAFLTVKGRTSGITRAEYEYGIPLADANEMLDSLTDGALIEKYRYLREFGGLTWEVDEFLGENRGLVMAEIELESADQQIWLPDWVGAEVSDDPRYYNANLAHKPYTTWKS